MPDILDFLSAASRSDGAADSDVQFSTEPVAGVDISGSVKQWRKKTHCCKKKPTAAQRLQLAGDRRHNLKHARAVRRSKFLDKKIGKLEKRSASCAAAWNSTQLKHGDRALLAEDGTCATHPEQFASHNAIKLGYTDSLDARLPSKQYLQVRALLVHCSLKLQHDIHLSAVKNVLSEPAGFLFIERSFDTTPVHLSFGHLAEQLRPHARYIVPRRWRDHLGQVLATYEDLIRFGVKPSQHGVLDVMVQHMVIEHGGGRVEVLMPARVMFGPQAGHTYVALQSALGYAWSTEALSALHKVIVILADNGDSASSNRKAMLFLGKHAGARIIYIANRCLVHQLFRGVVTILERIGLVKDLTSFTGVFKIAGRQDQFRRAVASIVSSKIHYARGLAPPGDDVPHRRHGRRILVVLIRDRVLRKEFANPLATPQQDEIIERCRTAYKLLQFPWHEEVIGHYCHLSVAAGELKKQRWHASSRCCIGSTLS